MRRALFVAAELAFVPVNAALSIVDRLINPIAEPAWNWLANVVLPEETPDGD